MRWTNRNAVQQVAAFLLMLSGRAVARGGPGNPVCVPMTCPDIADHPGRFQARCIAPGSWPGRSERRIVMRRWGFDGIGKAAWYRRL